MKKKFHLPLTAAISAAMLASAGCSSEKEWQTDSDTRVCVDHDGKRVPNEQCAPRSDGGISPFVWYYIARGGYVPYYGYRAGGGSWMPSGGGSSYTPAPASAPAGSVTRGGFGSVGEGHAAAGGGEGE